MAKQKQQQPKTKKYFTFLLNNILGFDLEQNHIPYWLIFNIRDHMEEKLNFATFYDRTAKVYYIIHIYQYLYLFIYFVHVWISFFDQIDREEYFQIIISKIWNVEIKIMDIFD